MDAIKILKEQLGKDKLTVKEHRQMDAWWHGYYAAAKGQGMTEKEWREGRKILFEMQLSKNFKKS